MKVIMEDMDIETCIMCLSGKKRGEAGRRKMSFAEAQAALMATPKMRALRNAKTGKQ